MKLETSLPVIAAVGIALGIGALGCNTRTAIGDVFDAGPNADASLDSLDHGTGGATGSGGLTGVGGGTAGAIGTTGVGGSVTGEGGAQAPGGRAGQPGGGTSPAGGRTGAAGGTPGTSTGGVGGANVGAADSTTCQSYMLPTGEAGHYGADCYSLTYPATGFYGQNILADQCTAFVSEVDYDLAVMGPIVTTVQVVMTSLSISGTRTGVGGAAGVVVTNPGWIASTAGDWRTRDYAPQAQQQVFETRPITDNETDIMFQGVGTARVDIYDCDPTTPSRSKVISWAPPHP